MGVKANITQALGRDAPYVSVLPVPTLANRAPMASDILPAGALFIDESVTPHVVYISLGNGTFSTGAFAGLNANGTINLNTSGAGVTTIGTGGTGATNIGNATGNTAVTGALAVSGLVTATGGLNTAPSVVAAGASPRTSNARSGQVTFSGVSIAAGATQSFVINNTAIAAIGTVILYAMVGATTGAALTIQSVTNVAGTSSTIVVQNGTGTTTTTANITFTYLVLN